MRGRSGKDTQSPRSAGLLLTASVLTDDGLGPARQRSTMPRMGHQPCPPTAPSSGPLS